MNYLAHIYLSGNNELIKIGNFMADGIRGSNYVQFPDDVIKGILLHRSIDTFTDAHPIFRKSKHRLHEKYGHYSGVIIDILYDHFLAKNWTTYSIEKLEDFAHNFYNSLNSHYDILSDKTKAMMPYMIARNWLVNYDNIAGIEITLFQMDHRSKHDTNMKEAIHELKLYYAEFEEEFTSFFEELRLHCLERLKAL